MFSVLKELDIEEKQTLLVINKIDAIPTPARLERILGRYPNAVPVSAATGQGLERLAHAVSDSLSHAFRDVDVEMNVGNGRLMAYLAANGEILSRSYNGTRVTIHCRLPQKYLGRIDEVDVQIRDHHRVTEALSDDVNKGIEDAAIEDVA